MVTISVLVTARLFDTHSLKDKRAIVRSVIGRLRSRLDCAAAEVGAQDDIRMAQIGFAVVSGSGATAQSLADRAKRQIEDDLIGRGEIIDAVETETRPGD